MVRLKGLRGSAGPQGHGSVGRRIASTSALLGILVSYALHDVPAMILVVGTVSSAVTGLLGGFLGSLIGRGRAVA